MSEVHKEGRKIMSAIDAKRAKKGGRYQYQTGRKSSGSGFFVIGVVGYQVPLTRFEERFPSGSGCVMFLPLSWIFMGSLVARSMDRCDLPSLDIRTWKKPLFSRRPPSFSFVRFWRVSRSNKNRARSPSSRGRRRSDRLAAFMGTIHK